MAITLTDRAAQHVQNYLTKRGKGVGVRFGVRTTGCSGMAYKLEFVDSASEDRRQCPLVLLPHQRIVPSFGTTGKSRTAIFPSLAGRGGKQDDVLGPFHS